MDYFAPNNSLPYSDHSEGLRYSLRFADIRQSDTGCDGVVDAAFCSD